MSEIIRSRKVWFHIWGERIELIFESPNKAFTGTRNATVSSYNYFKIYSQESKFTEKNN